MALVIKQWSASEKPDADGTYVRIHGRESGIINFVLAIIGVDPTTILVIDNKSVRLETGSLAGFENSVTPLTTVASVAYGYSKPWKRSLVIGAFGAALLSVALLWWLGLLLIIAAPIYYFLNKVLYLQVRDFSGHSGGRIEFKRSVIEGRSIDVQAGARIVGIVEMLLLGSEQPRMSHPAPTSTMAERMREVSEDFDAAADRAREHVDTVREQAVKLGSYVHRETQTQASAEVSDGPRVVSSPAPAESILRCGACGKILKLGDHFCDACGARV